MEIKKLAKNYYTVQYKGKFYYGTFLQALNEALVVVFFGFPQMSEDDAIQDLAERNHNGQNDRGEDYLEFN